MNFFISIFSQTISKVLVKTVLVGSVGVFGVGFVTDSVMATLNATAFNTVAQLDFPKEMPIRHWGQEGLSPVACKQFGFATYFAFAISLQKKQ